MKSDKQELLRNHGQARLLCQMAESMMPESISQLSRCPSERTLSLPAFCLFSSTPCLLRTATCSLAFRIESPQRRYPQQNDGCSCLRLRFNIKSYLRHHAVYGSVCDTASPCRPSSLLNSNLCTQPSWVERHLHVTPVDSLWSPISTVFPCDLSHLPHL